MVRSSRSCSRGFTLVEMLVASAVAGIAIAAAFTFATFQIRGYSEQQDIQGLAGSSRSLLETIIEDVRVAGLGTSFYAGVGDADAMDSRTVVTDGAMAPLGVPAVFVIDGVTGPSGGAPGRAVMPNSDSITVLRVEGEATFLPSSGVGNTGVPPQPGVAPYTVMRQAALAPCATGVTGSYLVLISDMVRQGEPASMLMELANVGGWGAADADGSGPIRFASGGNYGIDPSAVPATAGGILPAGRVFGPGSLVTCVRLVTYWLDDLGRVRMFQGTRTNITGGTTVGITGTWPVGAVRPIDPVNDAVIADNVRDLQFETFMSGMYTPSPSSWILNLEPGGAPPADPMWIVETRGVRVSALLASPRAGDARALNIPVSIANHTLTVANYPNTHTYRLVSYATEMRNLRHFDLMSDASRGALDVRSFRE